MKEHKLNFSLILTLARLILSPLFLPILLVYLLPINFAWVRYALAILYLVFGLTDFFDGFIARRLKQETKLGRILDPLADKFLLYAALIAFVAIDRLYFYWAILFIGREFFIMGLRAIAQEHHFSVPVSWLAKLKTAVQTVYILIVILNPYYEHWHQGIYWNLAEYGLLVLALVLSLGSAYTYFKFFMLEYRTAMRNNWSDSDMQQISDTL